ncbi:iron uptake transporter deferrochelatase/peroxidase subunit [Arthrobacter caoxuetaonis]|uniref:Deferrochelatase n=1 Tax=Arthrobacter caoxuetaonis TaxID=2886935 RepID=A0A9X1MBZ8_9MICC|nr:iron uptake transporter deferrochelatase/peroxidase subunit [Arthrobacter caoxuetaonis]MCC3297128.1 iron uptake transporter deferrochelatase/peroxidase subunit [Arthrobacter caoxuetaonis]USQ58310.1 iron uptake transporter deferrochelatase/peroxidase subunit [Arthrobacter caoxuetaonis]
MSPEKERGSKGLSRRGLFTAAGAGGLGLAAGAAGAFAVDRERGRSTDDVVPFHGTHQAGITTEAQDRMHTAAFDVTASTRASLVSLLRDWTRAAEAMTAGLEIGETGAADGAYDSPPEDTGEAQDLHASHLSVTFGFGRTLFEKDGADRFGIADKLPAALIDLPLFSGDALEENRSGGDLIVQACADDPQVAVHAVRNLARIAFGRARVRWSQTGFGRTASTSTAQVTPRNLFGFKDGTSNLKLQDGAQLEEHVWVSGSPASESWLDGGTYLVFRRIRMHIETWDRTTLREQEAVTGRTKREGAPLSGGEEFTAPDFGLQGRSGPLIDPASHLALAHPDHNNGVRMLRRGYNYVDGSDGLGRLDAGQAFIAFVVDPRTHYVPMQSAMSKSDLLAEYLRHTGSGLFAVPPGIEAGGYIGDTLFGS